MAVLVLAGCVLVPGLWLVLQDWASEGVRTAVMWAEVD